MNYLVKPYSALKKIKKRDKEGNSNIEENLLNFEKCANVPKFTCLK